MRGVIAMAVFVMTYLLVWLGLLLISVNLVQGAAALLPWLAGGLAAWWSWNRSARSGRSDGFRLLAGGAVGGAVGFMLGFFGPMVLAPEANPGPLLGLFITAPAGAILGLAVAWWWYR
jgi:hypothetical protein